MKVRARTAMILPSFLLSSEAVALAMVQNVEGLLTFLDPESP